MDIPEECHGFKVVQMKITPESEVIHYLYMKEHSVREICDEKPQDRTLFILGTPPFVTEESYKKLFSKYGVIENVYFHASPCATTPPQNKLKFFCDYPEVKGYKVAYIVFENESSVQSVLNEDPEKVMVLTSKDNELVTGMAKWCKEYNNSLADVDELQKDIDVFMADYDKMEEEQTKKEKMDMEPDDEGWTKVTRRGRKPGFARKESVHNRIMKKEAEKKQKKQLLNFYRFQIRETNMNQLVKLREKFEEDKKKIALLKQSRKFRPF